MLICSNDGFTGVDSLALPAEIGDRSSMLTAGYDAGTEINTEDFADFVPPCQGLIGVSSGEPGTGTTNPALAEGGVIHHHLGIAGGGDIVRRPTSQRRRSQGAGVRPLLRHERGRGRACN